VDACVARGIAATVGARYPARHRENLIQLFTPRHQGDPRPPVRGLAAPAPYVDPVQLQLGIPLPRSGPWPAVLAAACLARGPLLRFPDTPPFLDLERGLADASLVDAEVRLDFTPDASETFGAVSGQARLDAEVVEIDGPGFAETAVPSAPWPRLRAALRLS